MTDFIQHIVKIIGRGWTGLITADALRVRNLNSSVIRHKEKDSIRRSHSVECCNILRNLKFSGLVTLFPMYQRSVSEISGLLLYSDLPITSICLPSQSNAVCNILSSAS